MGTNHDPFDLIEILQGDVSRLTEEQRLIFDCVCHSEDSNLGKILFIDAPSGMGKMFLTKVILEKKHGRRISYQFPSGIPAHKINIKVGVVVGAKKSMTTKIMKMITFSDQITIKRDRSRDFNRVWSR
ncbi:unnamed protein product [Diatraea saccharalis]|uniref:ATP-dependent DNA helicase n=1 Tax=Diatraea saccharalis TaxID=40085 RepID=A0A9N9QVD9_9NEOP|nr:unnamed protein product [Diatraea saccharalis]